MKTHKNNNHSEDTRIALLEQSINNINDTLIRFEKRFDKLEEKIDTGFSKIDSRMWKNFYWTIAGFVGTWGMLAHVLHWV
jgi:hypothetical protein